MMLWCRWRQAFGWRSHLGIGVLLAVMLTASPALAKSCSYSSNMGVGFGSVLVPREAVVGDALTLPITQILTITCPPNTANALGDSYYITFHMLASQSANVPTAADTNVAGVGIVVRNVLSNYVLTAQVGGEFTLIDPIPASILPTVWVVTLSYQLVKTGPITAGQITSSGIFTIRTHDAALGQYDAPQNFVPISNTNVKVASCSITSPNVTVALPTLSTSAFPIIGATAGLSPFTIGLSCGIGSTVYVTMTDNTFPANRSTDLSLTAASTASGVKVQLLNALGRISYGADSAATGNTNQWLIGPSATTTGILLFAQYVRTGTVVPGSVGAVATFTMSYQ